jgi:hypothetical protein
MEDGSGVFGFVDVDVLILPIPLAGQMAVAMHFALGLEAEESET